VWDVDYSKIELRMGSPPDVVTCVAKVDKEKESKFILVNHPSNHKTTLNPKKTNPKP
jgi:hypothetical protein